MQQKEKKNGTKCLKNYKKIIKIYTYKKGRGVWGKGLTSR